MNMITWPSMQELLILAFIVASFAIILILAGKTKKESKEADKK